MSNIRCCGSFANAARQTNPSLRFAAAEPPPPNALLSEAVRYFEDDFLTVPLEKISETPVAKPIIYDVGFPKPYPDVMFKRGDDTFTLKFFKAFTESEFQYDLRNQDNSVALRFVKRKEGQNTYGYSITALALNGQAATRLEGGEELEPLAQLPIKILKKLGVISNGPE